MWQLTNSLNLNTDGSRELFTLKACICQHWKVKIIREVVDVNKMKFPARRKWTDTFYRLLILYVIGKQFYHICNFHDHDDLNTRDGMNLAPLDLWDQRASMCVMWSNLTQLITTDANLHRVYVSFAQVDSQSQWSFVVIDTCSH